MDHRPAEGPGGRSFAGRWRVCDLTGPAEELFGRPMDAAGPTAWLLTPSTPALVLGSTQPAVAAPFVRRRSGGGAVWLRPESVLWVDVFIPAGDALWEADVGRAFWWVGEVWAAAIGPPATVHRGPLIRTQWSDRVCFAGLGPGEVTIDGRKVVGISQRRWREGALFQCAALLRWDYEETAALMDVPPDDLREVAAGTAVERDGFLKALSAF